MAYIPKVNDYVIWNQYIQGWVYFKSADYITIEMNVRLKDHENYQASPIHENDRLLVLCYYDQWKELTYVKTRVSKYDNTEVTVETVGEGTGSEGIEE